MKTTAVTLEDLQGVFAVPPLAAARAPGVRSTSPRTTGSCAT